MRRKERTIVVIGGGGHAKVLIGVLRKLPWDIAGYTDSRDAGVLLGAPCLGDDSVLPDMIAANANCAAIIGLGKTDASSRRAALQGEIEFLGYEFPVIVSPDAVVNEGVALGAGTMVFDGAVSTAAPPPVRAASSTPAASWSTTAPRDRRARGARGHGERRLPHRRPLHGRRRRDRGHPGVSICAGCLIGAGAVVTADIAEPGVYAGVPARRIA